MSVKNKKQFGVWLDSQNATIVGRQEADAELFTIIGHEKNENNSSNSNENTSNNAEKGQQLKFFKQIMSHMPNVDEIHVTGTGTSQEQFIHFIAETAQYKNTIAKESTSNKMQDNKLVEFITEKFN